MTLQQLEYLVSIDKYRHFVKAAEACGVTQSNLSAMLHKLEEELGVLIFDRNHHPIQPTLCGERIIAQAKVLLFNASQLKEMVQAERELHVGDIKLGITPSMSTYILPKLFKTLREEFPDIKLAVSEMDSEKLISAVEQAELDMAILSTPLKNNKLLEIPVYREKWVAYVSPSETALYSKSNIVNKKLPTKNLWILNEWQDFNKQVLNLSDQNNTSTIPQYKASNIETLIKIVDENGGYTIIPELHVNLLSESQQKNIRHITTPDPVREISLIVRHDYMRTRILDVMSECTKRIIPNYMIAPNLSK